MDDDGESPDRGDWVVASETSVTNAMPYDRFVSPTSLNANLSPT